MIAIVNVSPTTTRSGPHVYELRINSLVLTRFVHKREESLAICLRRAATAVDDAQLQRLIDAL